MVTDIRSWVLHYNFYSTYAREVCPPAAKSRALTARVPRRLAPADAIIHIFACYPPKSRNHAGECYRSHQDYINIESLA